MLNDGNRRVWGQALQQALLDVRQTADAHVDHQSQLGRMSGVCNLRPVGPLIARLGMSGEEQHPMRVIAMRERNLQRCHRSQTRRDAVDHRDLHAVRLEVFHFFATASKHEGVAAFEANHHFTRFGFLHHEFLDERLRGRLASAALSHIHHTRRRRGMRQHIVANQIVDQQHGGRGNGFDSFEREQVRIARTGADQKNVRDRGMERRHAMHCVQCLITPSYMPNDTQDLTTTLADMLILGIESSCDETGVALVRAESAAVPVLLAQALHTQVAMHEAYGGVVPELASRDHIRRVIPLAQSVMAQSGRTVQEVDVIAFTRGPGLAGALLVGAGVACALGAALDKPVMGVHHLEGHLLSPFLSADPPEFPFVALLVSGGHTQLMQVNQVGDYQLLGETIDDAAGEAFDKSAKLLGLGYPGGPALARLAQQGNPQAFALPRPLLHSGDLDFSFAGLKTAVLTQAKKLGADLESRKADLAASTQAAIVEVLVKKSLRALQETGLRRLVVAGGVGANQALRAQLNASCMAKGIHVHYPELHLCTDNGAMIAMAAAMRLQRPGTATQARRDYRFEVKPRWPLEALKTAID